MFWQPPQGALIEVRSGRAKDKFEKYGDVNRGRNLKLLSLHINEGDIHSAVWILSDHFELASAFLAAHGIFVAENQDG